MSTSTGTGAQQTGRGATPHVAASKGTQIASTAIVHPNVQLGEGCVVGDFVVLGEPPRGAAPGDVPTVIGPGAHIRSHTVIYAGNVIGAGFQTGHGALLRESNTVGDNVSVGSHSIVEHHVQIADRVRIHSQAFIPEFSTLERGSWLGPGVRLTNAPHPLSPDAKDCLVGPTLAPGAKIGANATLLPGVKIGENALVGAGAVVTRDVAPGDVVVGNPARVVKHIRDLVSPATGLNPYRDVLGLDVDAQPR